MAGNTGKKISGLENPSVAVESTDVIALETLANGEVVKVNLEGLAAIINTQFMFNELGFNGTNLAVPATANSGKFPAEDAKIIVSTNGVLDILDVDYTITRNAGATPDEVVFTNARTGQNIFVIFKQL